MTTTSMSRRRVMQVAALLSAAVALDLTPRARAGATTSATATPSASDIMTLEAFADTAIPGAKRSPDDVAIAGAAPGPGAVQGGAITLLEQPDAGMSGQLSALAAGLNQYAAGYAQQAGITLDPSLPPFVALAFGDRTAVAANLTSPLNPSQIVWSLLILLIGLAFDGAEFEPTTTAIADDHPGLVQTLGFPAPGPDGLWRNPQSSYGRQLAPLYPATTRSGSPA